MTGIPQYQNVEDTAVNRSTCHNGEIVSVFPQGDAVVQKESASTLLPLERQHSAKTLVCGLAPEDHYIQHKRNKCNCVDAASARQAYVSECGRAWSYARPLVFPCA